MLPSRQSAYRQHHSAEIDITVVHNDIVRAIDAGEVSVLILLDLSAAVDVGEVSALLLLDLSAIFDTVDHDVLLDELQTRFGCCALAGLGHTCLTGHNRFALHLDSRLLSVCNAVFRKALEAVRRSLSCSRRMSPKQ